MDRGQKIRDLRESLGMSQTELAKRVKTTKQNIYKYETGIITNIPSDKVELLSRVLGVSPAYLMGWEERTLESIGAVPYNPTHKIPILGRISAGLPLYADEHIEGYIYTELNHGGEYFALRVQGDSMNNRKIDDGDIVIIKRQPEVENGEIAVVLVDGDDATIKQFFQEGATVMLVPHSSNPEHTTQIYNCKHTPIKILGRLMRSITDF